MPESQRPYRMGVDIGGTFVDFALWDSDGEMAVYKVPAEPGDLAGSIMRGIAQLAEQRGADVGTFLRATTLLVHGTTVATNAVLTGRGSRTALLTTRGTRDALEMRRGVKEEPLDNKYEPPAPMVPRYLRLPVDERVDWNGNVLEELDAGSLEAAVKALKFHEVEAVAVCLMHAYANGAHERRVAERLRAALPEAYLTVSSELLPQSGYYSRVSTAVLNSYVGPLLESYLLSLSAAFARSGFRGTTAHHELRGRTDVAGGDHSAGGSGAVVGSGGGAGGRAGLRRRSRSVRLRGHRHGRHESGHLPGVGRRTQGGYRGPGRALRHGVADDRHPHARRRRRQHRPCRRGRGAFRWARRAPGRRPGPACYGKGGTLPTCTDVDLLLGYLDPRYFLGGRMPLLREPAERAVREHLAGPLGISVEEAAVAAFEVINAGMAAGIRDMIVDHGLDPEAMPMVVGGGAGPVHAARGGRGPGHAGG